MTTFCFELAQGVKEVDKIFKEAYSMKEFFKDGTP
jgi:hypothetical protein